MAELKLGRKRLQNIKSSKLVIIPKTVLEHWRSELGEEPEEVELILVDGGLKILPVKK